MTNVQHYLIALGANLPSRAGPPDATLRAALDALERSGAHVATVSRFFRTPCFPAGAGPDFVNAAAQLSHAGTPRDVLDLLHTVEAGFGRERHARWAGRTLDLDLIAADGLILPDPQVHAQWRDLPIENQQAKAPDQLILPHPRLQDRAFVLVPLADVAPDWRHPVLGLSVTEMLAALPKTDRDAAVPLA